MTRNEFKLTFSGSDFDLTCVEGDWHCKGFSILKISNRYYVQSPKQKETKEAFLITKAYFLKELYGWFEEPNKEEIKKMHSYEWVKLAEANSDFIRGIYLAMFWNLNERKQSA